MSSPLTDRLLTLADYAALPDDDRYIDELSRGRLVREPRPGRLHSAVVVELIYVLRRYLAEHPGIGEVHTECGFILSEDPYILRGPDVAFVRTDRLPGAAQLGFFQSAPDIAIEVVSPSNTAADLQQKVIEFLAAGTSAVWVIYPQSRIAVAHFTDGSSRIHAANDALETPLLPGFMLKVADLLR